MNDEISIETMVDEIVIGVFKNKSVLKVSYTPKKLSDALHREDVIKKYQRFLLDVFRGLAPSNILLYGKSGTGKTMITKLVLEDLATVAEKKEINANIIYIDCESSRTENSIWAQINRELVEIIPGHTESAMWNSRARHALYFKQIFSELDGLLIIVLDEIDKAADFDIINKLARTISKFNDQPPCLICITNDVKFREYLKPHAISVLAQNELQIDPYNAEQIADILVERAKIAFYPNSFEEIVIPLCSAFAAQEHGDARRAINLLAKAAEFAEYNKRNIITEDDVRYANDKLEEDRILEIIRTLPTQSKVTLLACTVVFCKSKPKDCLTGTIYNIYKQFCMYIGVDILTQRRVSDLISELDMMGVLNTVVLSKGRYGRSRQIGFDGNYKRIQEICLEDYMLKPLENFIDKATPSFFSRDV